jgi:hypothetical protein
MYVFNSITGYLIMKRIDGELGAFLWGENKSLGALRDDIGV